MTNTLKPHLRTDDYLITLGDVTDLSGIGNSKLFQSEVMIEVVGRGGKSYPA